MKRKFRMLMSFLSKLKKDKISVSWSAPDGDPEWFYTNVPQNVSIPQNIIDNAVEQED